MNTTKYTQLKSIWSSFSGTGNIIRIKPQGYSMYPLLIPGRDEALSSRQLHRLPQK